MKIRHLFGLFFFNAALKLMRLSEKCMTGVIGTEPTTDALKIWGVLEGPIHRDEFMYQELIPPDCTYMLVCKVEEGGKIGNYNLWYETLEEALDIKNYFNTNIEPLELKDD